MRAKAIGHSRKRSAAIRSHLSRTNDGSRIEQAAGTYRTDARPAQIGKNGRRQCKTVILLTE